MRSLTDILKTWPKKKQKPGYRGNYVYWQDAQRDSSGYDAADILEKVKTSMLKIRDGKAVYERDSVLFDTVQYSWPLLAGLLLVATQRENKLHLIDFGGSLGSSYFQNRGFLSCLSEMRWSIIEQENFVECGKQNFENDQLKFYYSFADCLKDNSPDVVLLSSVLPYIETPYKIIEEIIAHKFPFIIIDRTPLINTNTDRLTVQHVHSHIYPASYPAWILSKVRLLELLGRHYELIAEFDAISGKIDLGDIKAFDTGLILRRKGL